MSECKSQDPVEHLPDALAKLESMIADKIAAELAPARTRIAELERVVKSTTIITWKLNRERYEAIPYMANGQAGPPLDLRGLFEQFFSETAGAGAS